MLLGTFELVNLSFIFPQHIFVLCIGFSPSCFLALLFIQALHTQPTPVRDCIHTHLLIHLIPYNMWIWRAYLLSTRHFPEIPQPAYSFYDIALDNVRLLRLRCHLFLDFDYAAPSRFYSVNYYVYSRMQDDWYNYVIQKQRITIGYIYVYKNPQWSKVIVGLYNNQSDQSYNILSLFCPSYIITTRRGLVIRKPIIKLRAAVICHWWTTGSKQSQKKVVGIFPFILDSHR